MEITKKYYIIDRKNISYLKFIFEACEGIATITTMDPGSGLILFRIPPGCENDFETVILGLKKEIMIEEYMPDVKEGIKEGNEYEAHLY
ncbi:MAG: DUF4911 domain-containing protein [Desulfobacterales bacterium]